MMRAIKLVQQLSADTAKLQETTLAVLLFYNKY